MGLDCKRTAVAKGAGRARFSRCPTFTHGSRVVKAEDRQLSGRTHEFLRTRAPTISLVRANEADWPLVGERKCSDFRAPVPRTGDAGNVRTPAA